MQSVAQFSPLERKSEVLEVGAVKKETTLYCSAFDGSQKDFVERSIQHQKHTEMWQKIG